jgi:hypothetical protein
MAKQMKSVAAPRRQRHLLVVPLDVLCLPRGRQLFLRGGAHRTAKRPSRSQAKRAVVRQFDE